MTFTIRDLMEDPKLLGEQFGGESWTAWRALLCGFYGLPLSEQEQAIFEALTKRKSPLEALLELALVIGRRGGKSICAGLLCIYEGFFVDHRDKLSPGELATVLVLSADRLQSRNLMNYVTGLILSCPMLKAMVLSMNKETIELENNCIIRIGTASFRTTRGYTFAAAICDEIAFWRSDDSANPDFEIINAIRPGLATLEGKLIMLSSPYSRKGVLYDTYTRYYGKEGDVLVAQAESRTMNALLPQRVVDAALERDHSAASAEYLAQFRSDLEQFLSREVVDDAVRIEPLEHEYDKSKHYFAFVDPSGGGPDEFCLAIGHLEKDRTIVDLVRARKGTPATITAEYAQIVKSYGLSSVTGDRYAGSWPGDEFQNNGINYMPAKKPRSDLYLDLLPALNSGRVELPPDNRMVNQLIGLERRTSRSGKDSINHPPNAHDDRANAIAGLVSMATRPRQTTKTTRLKYL